LALATYSSVMRSYDNQETTLQTSYRSSASDVIIGGGAVLGVLFYASWPLLKALLAS